MKESSKTMQSVIIGFIYATSRWLALVGLSLVFFFLVLEYFPLLRIPDVVKHTSTNKPHTSPQQA
jgi:hypothetical protein